MWTILLSSREARELCSIYVKAVILLVIFIHPFIKSNVEAFDGVGNNGRGGFCQMDKDCDQSQFLQCVGNMCDCARDRDIIWVAEERSCMRKEDSRCRDDGIPCVTSSSCLYGKCECNDNYLRSGSGTCELTYGNKCSERDTCARRYALECVGTSDPNDPPTCRCFGEGEDMVWDIVKRKCVSLASGSCDTPESPRFRQDDRQECIKNAECMSPGYCQCKPGFIKIPDGTCKLQYNQPCNSSSGKNDCNELESLVCRDGKCVCEFYGQMIYDEEINQCRTLVEERCNNGNRERDANWKLPICVKDAVCKPQLGSHKSTCVCLPGFSTTSERTCSRYNKGYGQQCSASMDCDRKLFLECILDEDQWGRCRCPQYDMFWDGSRCRVYPGKVCTHNRHCAVNSFCEGTWCICNQGYSIVNSNCVVTNNEEEFQLVTPAPATGTTSSPTQSSWHIRHAENTFGSNCDQNVEQDSAQGKLCSCRLKPETHSWVPERSACLALVGTPCGDHSECIPDAICEYSLQICQCSPGTHTTKDRTCYRHQGTRECTEISHTLKSVHGGGNRNYVGSGLTIITVIMGQYF